MNFFHSIFSIRKKYNCGKEKIPFVWMNILSASLSYSAVKKFSNRVFLLLLLSISLLSFSCNSLTHTWMVVMPLLLRLTFFFFVWYCLMSLLFFFTSFIEFIEFQRRKNNYHKLNKANDVRIYRNCQSYLITRTNFVCLFFFFQKKEKNWISKINK